MPTYDYSCKTCGHRFEYFQSITADALKTCPESECIQEDPEKKGKGEVKRLVSGGAGLVFKGEGFYLTDYVKKSGGEKSEGKKESSSKESSSSKKSEGSSGSGTSSGSSSGSAE